MPQGAKKVVRKVVDAYESDLAERIATAFKQFNAKARRGNELTQADLGRLVAKRLHRDAPFSQVAVSNWMNPKNPSPPNNQTLIAIAGVLEVDEIWLILGYARD